MRKEFVSGDFFFVRKRAVWDENPQLLMIPS